MPKILIGIVVIILLGGGAYYYTQVSQPAEPAAEEQVESDEQMMEDEVMMEEEEHMEEGVMMESHVIVFSDSGYDPKELTIHKGDTVTFKNNSGKDTWPASAQHPTHTVYPGSDIKKCFDETSDTSLLFDSCAGIASGAEWSFTFTESGKWGYHDHLGVSNWGQIIVEE